MLVKGPPAPPKSKNKTMRREEPITLHTEVKRR